MHGLAGLDPLLDRIGSARYVLISEASHGTADFYRWQAELTKRLVAERGFSFVGVEGDWPDCHRLQLPRGGRAQRSAAVLWDLRRWPRSMWANEEVVDFARWLCEFNAAPPVGFHGLDVYSLWDSLHAVVDYLREHEPDRVDAGGHRLPVLRAVPGGSAGLRVRYPRPAGELRAGRGAAARPRSCPS